MLPRSLGSRISIKASLLPPEVVKSQTELQFAIRQSQLGRFWIALLPRSKFDPNLHSRCPSEEDHILLLPSIDMGTT